MHPTRQAPKSAIETVHAADEDHNFKHEPINYGTTGGIQRALERNWSAINRLAEWIDGVRPGDVDGGQRSAEEARLERQRAEARGEWKAGTPPGPNGPDDMGTPGVEKVTPVNTNPSPPAA